MDQVLQGMGTTNNGNTARRCLEDPHKLAACLGIDEGLVERLYFVLLAYKQKRFVDQQILYNYSIETSKLIFLLYPWCQIPPTVHKLLVHGVQIQQHFSLPLAFYAEDAGESCHKIYRINETHHARQISRKSRLQDVFNYSLYFSDPLLSNIYASNRLKFKNINNLPSNFVALFNITQ